jgi:tetratricopeptide (TPR) repeat protein
LEGFLLAVVVRPMRVLALAAALWPIASVASKAATFEELAAQAASARRGNSIPEAIQLYRQAVELRSNWEEGWWFIGTLSYSTYHFSDCEAAFDQFVKLDDKRALAWSLLGLCEFETGNYTPALDHLRQGLAGKNLAPEVDAGVRFHYGLLLSKQGLFDQGMHALSRYARGGAHESMLIEGLGLNALHQPLLPKEIPADRLDAVERAGEASRSLILGKIADAQAGFQELIERYPAVPGVHYLYGTFLSYSRPEEAIAEFHRELDLDPGNVSATAMLALMLLNTDKLADAIPYAKKAAAEKPSDAKAEYVYGEALLKMGDLQAAVPMLESAERLDPGALEYHMALASAYARLGRREDARRERQASLDMAGFTHSAVQNAESGTTVRATAKTSNASLPENR